MMVYRISPLLAFIPLSLFHPCPASLGERLCDMLGIAALAPIGRSCIGTSRLSSLSLRSVSLSSVRGGGGGSARRTVSKFFEKRSKPELSLCCAGRPFLTSGSPSNRLRLNKTTKQNNKRWHHSQKQENRQINSLGRGQNAQVEFSREENECNATTVSLDATRSYTLISTLVYHYSPPQWYTCAPPTVTSKFHLRIGTLKGDNVATTTLVQTIIPVVGVWLLSSSFRKATPLSGIKVRKAVLLPVEVRALV